MRFGVFDSEFLIKKSFWFCFFQAEEKKNSKNLTLVSSNGYFPMAQGHLPLPPAKATLTRAARTISLYMAEDS